LRYCTGLQLLRTRLDLESVR